MQQAPQASEQAGSSSSAAESRRVVQALVRFELLLAQTNDQYQKAHCCDLEAVLYTLTLCWRVQAQVTECMAVVQCCPSDTAGNLACAFTPSCLQHVRSLLKHISRTSAELSRCFTWPWI
jgi:hypothetical protein